MYKTSYINKKYKPGRNDLVAQFYLEPNRIKFDKAANHVAGESSIGTWTDVVTMNQRIAKRLSPKIYYLNPKTGMIKIAYPSDLFEIDNVPQILSSIAGNIFGMKSVRNLRLIDVNFPLNVLKKNKGPKFGISGLRKLIKVNKRPFVGTIVKPKVGLTAKEHAKVAYDAWLGGCDCVKDDENLTSQKFNNFKERIRETLKLKEKAESETGEKKIYMPNITNETIEMLKRYEYVLDHGGNYVMVDVLTVGFAGLQSVRKFGKLPIHAHRAMHAALTRYKKHGITMLTVANFCRLIGVDTLHIGAIFGKMEGAKSEVLDIEDDIEEDFVTEKQNILKQNWHSIKPVMAVASGGLHPGKVDKVIGAMGKDIVLQFGGGIHGHNSGTQAGARAARQAVDAVMKGISLREYAKTRWQLNTALRKWA